VNVGGRNPSPVRSSRYALVAVAFILACVAAGCDDEQEPQEPQKTEDKGGSAAQGEGSTEPAAAEDSESAGAEGSGAGDTSKRPWARVRFGEGDKGTAAEAGRALVPGAMLTTGEGSGLVVSFRRGGRVELGKDAHARIGGSAPAQLFVAEGRAYATLPPAGNSPRPGLHVATATASIRIGSSGDAWVVALPDGSTWVAMLRGTAEVVTGQTRSAPADGDDSGAGDKLRAWRVRAGQQMRITADGVGSPESGPQKVEQARARTAKLREAAGTASEPARRRAFEARLKQLDPALEALAAERKRATELQRAGDAAGRDGGPDPREVQKQLVQHSQARFRLRRIALAQWERTQACGLRVAQSTGEMPESLAPRRARARKLLGIAGPDAKPEAASAAKGKPDAARP
jgi:hypothetical protein